MARFRDLLRAKSTDFRELELFSNLCREALLGATRAVRIVELEERAATIAGITDRAGSPRDFTKLKANAASIATFAEAQERRGLPYLFGVCSVRLWSLLETLVDELVVEALRTPESCPDRQVLAKLRGPLLDFHNASPDERAEFLAETLKQVVEAPLKQGVGKFEACLSPVGLGGEVDGNMRRVLFELSNVRNVIVHKGGKADKRLIDACPWLSYARGASVDIDMTMFGRYMTAGHWYLVELLRRVCVRDSTAIPDDLDGAQAELVAVLTLAGSKGGAA
jgi:hypothetical protein